MIEEHLDVEKMWQIATTAPEVPEQTNVWDVMEKVVAGANTATKVVVPCATTMPVVPEAAEDDAAPRIGYVHDDALWFYYDENLQALQHAGAELVRLSVTSPAEWPHIDALYLGGGFPETLHKEISANTTVCEHVRMLAEQNMPIYAECGGFMYLCQGLLQDDTLSPMAGVLPVKTQLCKRPQGWDTLMPRSLSRIRITL